MNRLLRILIIGALLALLAYPIFRYPYPPARQIHAEWGNISDSGG